MTAAQRGWGTHNELQSEGNWKTRREITYGHSSGGISSFKTQCLDTLGIFVLHYF